MERRSGTLRWFPPGERSSESTLGGTPSSLREAPSWLLSIETQRQPQATSAQHKRAEAVQLANIEGANKPELTVPNSSNPPGTHPSGLRSTRSTVQTTIKLTNDRDRPLDIYWIDFEGKERRSFTLPPGKTATQRTFVGHSWIMRDAGTETQIATAVASSEPSTLRIGEPRRTENPEVPAPTNPLGTHPSGLRSIGSTVPTTITFTNDGDISLNVYWIDFGGKERRYFTLTPGKTVLQRAFVGHSWIIRDADTERQIATTVASSEPSTLRISEPRRAEKTEVLVPNSANPSER